MVPLGSITSANSYAAYGHFLKERPDDLMDDTRNRLEMGRQVTGAEYARALRHLEQLRYQVGVLMEKYDLLLTPTMAVPAFSVGQRPDYIAGRQLELDRAFNPFSLVFNMTQQPAASIPCGFSSDGLPIGLQIAGRRREEVTVLPASAAFEQVRPWADKRPPIS